MLSQPLYIFIAAIVCIAVLITLYKTGHFLRTMLFSVVSGNLALLAVAYSGAFTGVVLTFNLFTVSVASVLGIPGVLTMLLIKLIFGV